MRYWKKYNNEFYKFEDAYVLWKQLFEKLKNPSLQVKKDNTSLSLKFDATNIPSNVEYLEIPLWAAKSDKWEVLIPDDEKNQKAEEIVNWIQNDLNFELDTERWNSSKMTIKDLWLNLNEQLIDEDVAYDIMMWLKNVGRLNKYSKNLVYSYLNNK